MQESNINIPYDALLVVSFGGPEGPEEVMPFLDNVLRGRNVPLERKKAVAEHYFHFGGISPINEQNRKLIAALKPEIEEAGPRLPIYWGNRNWHPMLSDTIQQMAFDGVKRALAFVTAAYSSYSSCRQYQEDISEGIRAAGDRAPKVDKLRAFYNHPGFVEANADNLSQALSKIPEKEADNLKIVFTAHSIPESMAAGCAYEGQLLEACRLVIQALGISHQWQLAFQSRSGPAGEAWLKPDILDYMHELKQSGGKHLVVVPIGFLCDHMEVVFDLDTRAFELSTTLGVNFVRAATVGTHPRFIKMVRQLVDERIDQNSPRLVLGDFGAAPDFCPATCCPRSQPSESGQNKGTLSLRA